MACNRGCTGTNINNATNVCGIQIQHNCSPGCAGLAAGQSRLQFDVLGNLVVCTNIGGACNCDTVDAVTPTTATRNLGVTAAGGNTIDIDTDGDGATDITICEGFCSIVSANDCVSGGVGADYAVKSFVMNNDALTINGASEHTSAVTHVPRIIVTAGIEHKSNSTGQLSTTPTTS